MLQSHRQRTEEEFLGMVQKRMSDAGRAKMLADLFFDTLAREWLDETLVAVAADIRAQCLADMPDASGAAERAYQQAFVERNWEEVIEYVLDVNAYLHKIFTALFEAEHPEWLPFPKEDRELLADSVLKAAWVNCREPLLLRYDMVDSTPAEWIEAYEEPRRKLGPDAVDLAEQRLTKYGYNPDGQ